MAVAGLVGVVLPAMAQERVVMPFACAADAGGVVLEPAAERSYAIIGRREQQPFTACSPADSARCRTWMLHRFDLDCGGTRVAWMDVVASAAAGRTRRVWVEDGRLRLRFGVERVDARGRPCFRRPWQAAESWPGQGSFLYNRGCGPFRSREAATVISMPAGFAPLMHLGARFVPVAAPLAAKQDEPAAGMRSALPRQARESSDDMRPREETRARDTAAPAKGPAPQAPRPRTGTSAGSKAAVETSDEMRPREETRARDTAASDKGPAPQAPRARTSTDGASRVGTSARIETAEAAAPTRFADTKLAAARIADAGSKYATPRPARQSATEEPPHSAAAATVQSWRTRIEETTWAHRLAEFGAPGATVTFLLLGLLTLSLAAMSWLRPRRSVPGRAAMRAQGRGPSAPAMSEPPPRPQTTAEQAAGEDLMRNTESFFQHVSEIVRDMKAAGPLRDVVADELKAVEAVLCSPALVTAYARQDWPYVRASTVQILTDLERIRRIVQGANEAAAAGPVTPRDIIVPADRDEALAILGVNADASEKVVKKIVDAMRQTWHPDLARDDADRRAREARLKQINSAWDLVRSRPHAV